MVKKCDNKSVGIIIQNENGDFLMIERMKYPFGFAPVAGHLDDDGDDYKTAAVREASEEVGLDVKKLTLLLDKDLENQFGLPCSRGGSERTSHHWQVFRADKWGGELKRSKDETKQVRWVAMPNLLSLAIRTEAYINEKISDEDWETNPGFEEVWYRIFKILGII